MPQREACTVIDVATALGGGERGPFPFEQFARHALAQGDSWMLAVADELTARTGALPAQLMDERRAGDPACNLHLADTLGRAGVALAAPGAGGSSGDWINEIHLTRAGYRKCTAVWADVMDPSLG
jgi:hypothetical protein